MMERRKYGRLRNALVELCVVVGMDEDTGLVPAQKSSVQMCLDSPDFNPFILAAVSGEVGVFTQAGCPSVETFVLQSTGSPSLTQITSSVGLSKKRVRQPTLSPSVALAKIPELPLSSEEIGGLPPFCLPGSTNVFMSEKSAHCHSFVMTDLSGVHRYTMCLTYYRKFTAIPSEGEKPNCYALRSVDSEQLNGSIKHEECYVPTCICLIANQPYYQVLRDCLSIVLLVGNIDIISLIYKILDGLTDSTLQLQRALLEFVPKLALIPIPPAGSISVSFDALGFSHSLHPALPYRPVCGMHLYHPFTLLSVDDVLRVVCCILTEKRIVFLSSSVSLLTPVIESFFSFILPFTWRHTYIPVLSSKLTDYIAAPGTFIMGCDSSVEEQLDKFCPDGIVAVNLDAGTVVMDQEILTPLPTHAVKLFKSRFRAFPKPFDLQTSLPSYLDAREEKQSREMHAARLDANIRAAFVEMLALIFRDVNTFCGFDTFQPVFKKKKFLESRQKAYYDFYNQVCSTDMFGVFVNERLQRRQDYFDQEVEEINKAVKTSEGNAKVSPGGPSSLRRKHLQKIASTKLSDVLKNPKSLAVDEYMTVTSSSTNELVLPEVQPSHFTNGGHYYDICLETVTTALEEASTANLRACYRYVRGLLHLACGDESKAIEDLQTIERENRTLYPEKLLDILTGKDERARKRRGVIDPDRMPRHDLDEREFEKLVIRMGILTDLDSAAKGWACLSGNQFLSKDLFSSFVNTWRGVMKVADHFELPDGVQPRHGEDVVLISGRVRHSQGIGRLVLTHHRLLMMHDAVCHKVTELTDISSTEKITSPFLYNIGQDGLKLTLSDGERYIVCLKEASALWQLYIEELIAANEIALGHKNPSIVQSAGGNVMVAYAIHELMLDFDVLSMTRGSEAALASPETLLFCRLKDNIKLPPVTFEALDCIIFPPSYDITRRTIECMLYTKPEQTNEAEKRGRLWCGFGSALLVCDVTNWTFDFPIPIAKERISCLAAAGENLWAGSLDMCVYIINMATKTVVSSLKNHEDFVIEITTQNVNSNMVVWTIGVDGHFIAWNPESINKELEFQLEDVYQVSSPVVRGEHIWFCERRRKIMVVDTKPPHNIIRKLSTKISAQTPLSADCLVLTPNQQIWCAWSIAKDKTRLVAWNAMSFEEMFVKEYNNCPAFSNMVIRENQVWIGTKDGRIIVIDWSPSPNYHVFNKRELKQAHAHAVRSLCVIHGERVASGSTSMEGHIAIWKGTV